MGSVSVEYGWVREDTYLYVSITAVTVIVLALVGVLLLRKRRVRGDSV